MRIGIDAKWFFRGPVSTQVVLQNLLPELFTHYPEHEWILFLDTKDKNIPFPFNSHKVKLEYVWADINMLSNVFLLPKKLRSLKLDVMVYQTFPSLGKTTPSIAFIHDVLFRRFPQFFSWKEKLYFLPLSWLTRNRSERLIVTTEFVLNELLKYNYTSSKSIVDIVPLAVSNAYKPAEFHDPNKLSEVKKKFNLPDQFLLFVGRLNVRKNIENLLRAILLIHNTCIQLVIVGIPDWKVPDLQNLLSNPELKNRIILTGAMTADELVLTFSMARIFCFPSFAEGFGLPPLEAMASGVPVIVSETTALPEVCGNAALYINPDKPDSIAFAINTLLEDEELYQIHKSRGLQHAKKFTWSVSANAFMKSINNAANIQ